MTDFKSAAEQQVRETLGWRTYCPTAPHEVMVFNLAVSKTAELMQMTAQRDGANKATTDLLNLHDDALIRAETAEKQRDEAQKALQIVDEALKECCDERREFHDQLKKALGVAEDGRIWFGAGLLRAVEAVRTRAETAERERGESWATIREQAERIKELRQSLLDVKALLGGAEYSVGRSDGRPFDLPEAIRIGNIFEKADKAIEASNER